MKVFLIRKRSKWLQKSTFWNSSLIQTLFNTLIGRLFITWSIIDSSKSNLYIVMEYCGGGDLGKMIKSHLETKELIPEEDIWKLSWQIFEALKECHCNKGGKIIHWDLKPGNIFIDSWGKVKLGDFGLSWMMGD